MNEEPVTETVEQQGREPAPSVDSTPPVGAAPPTGFYRSREDRILFGICSAVARRLGISPLLARAVFLLTLLFAGSGIFFYLAAALVIPEEPGDGSPKPSRDMSAMTRLLAASFVLVGAAMLIVLMPGIAAVSATATAMFGAAPAVLAAVVLLIPAAALLANKRHASGIVFALLAAAVVLPAAAVKISGYEIDDSIGEGSASPKLATPGKHLDHKIGIGDFILDLTDVKIREIAESRRNPPKFSAIVNVGETRTLISPDKCIEYRVKLTHPRAGEVNILGHWLQHKTWRMNKRIVEFTINRAAGSSGSRPVIELDLQSDFGVVNLIDPRRRESVSIEQDGTGSSQQSDNGSDTIRIGSGERPNFVTQACRN